MDKENLRKGCQGVFPDDKLNSFGASTDRYRKSFANLPFTEIVLIGFSPPDSLVAVICEHRQDDGKCSKATMAIDRLTSQNLPDCSFTPD